MGGNQHSTFVLLGLYNDTGVSDRSSDTISRVHAHQTALLSEESLITRAEMNPISQHSSKVSKPLMERRRRARINASIGELRALLIQARATTSCQSSKLEKAEILEFTVRHLRALRRPSTDSAEWSRLRFCAGYAACAREITRFFRTTDRLPDAGHRDAPQSPDPLTHTRVWRPWS